TLRCVASLAAAGAPDLQVVVVDDGGTDGTDDALAAADPQIEILRLSPAAGFTRAANQGLARAHGDLLLLLNSDTEVEPGAFAALLAAFDRDPRLGAAGAVLHYPDGSPQWSGGRAPGLLWLFALASGLPERLGGGGPDGRGVPLLCAGPRPLSAIASSGLVGRAGPGIPRPPSSRSHHRTGFRRRWTAAPRAAVDRSSPLGRQTPRRRLGAPGRSRPACRRGPAPARPEPRDPLRRGGATGRLAGGERGLSPRRGGGQA